MGLIFNSFVFSTEMIALVLGIAVHFFTKINKPKKTIEYKLIFLAVCCLMFECITKFGLLAYTEFAGQMHQFVINILAVIIWLLHTLVSSLLIIYIYRLSDIDLNSKLINKIMISGTIVYVIAGLFLLHKGNMYKITADGFELVYLYVYIEFWSLFILITCYGHILVNRQHFPKTIFRYVLPFGPVMFAMQLLQICEYRIIFSGIVYMIPLEILFFLYHNDSYDLTTGIRNRNALDGYFERIISHKIDHALVVVDYDRIVNFEGMEQERLSLDFWRLCRRFEYLSKKIALFDGGDDQILILIYETDSKKQAELISSIRDQIQEFYDKYSGRISMNAVVSLHNDGIYTLNKGAEYANYLRNKKEFTVGFNWIVSDPEKKAKFEDYYKVKQAILDIDKKCDLYDPRVLCYAQPIYEVNTNSFRTAEALMRLQLDDEMISPAVFIPIAEQTNVIHSITKIMLNKVCQFIETYGDTYDFDAISINTSMLEMALPDCADSFLGIIESHNIQTSKIRIEIIESNTVEGSREKNTAIANLERLYKAGILIYLDDYGTGYSNLSRVMSMNLNTIKFDKSILYKAMEDDRTKEVISILIRAFKDNGSLVLVEGVETPEQAQFAKAHGFEYIQGFLYAKPEPIVNLKNHFLKK